MRCGWFWLILLALAAFSAPTHAQHAVSDNLLINAQQATTWSEGPASVIQLRGSVTITLDYAQLSADDAVVWLRPIPGAVLDYQMAEIALLGHARITQQHSTREGDELFADAVVRGSVRITADKRSASALNDSPEYRRALALRTRSGAAPLRTPDQPLLTPAAPATLPATPATQPFRPREPVTFRNEGRIDSTLTAEGKMAIVISGNVLLMQRQADGSLLTLSAERAVLFTPLESLLDLRQAENVRSLYDVIVAAYLEGDVRITRTPPGLNAAAESLRAERVYYDFLTDRAVLTDVILHTTATEQQTPIVIRAQKVRQLSQGEYRARGVKLSTSSFATPTYSIGLDKAYVRQDSTSAGERVVFWGTHARLNAFDVPVFYFPIIGGEMVDRGWPLRQIQYQDSRGFGPSILTDWGLFESLGQSPPESIDASYSLNYFGDRGPAGGLTTSYSGGFITETDKEPWTFDGDFTSYLVYDSGRDRLGRRRPRVAHDDELRGWAEWEHQHFLPDDWQAQLTASYISDPTFLEEWFRGEFNTDRPHDTSIYLKRQRQSEAFTFLYSVQLNDFPTVSDVVQEQAEVERVPEFGYHRIGDSFAEDSLTFFSNNTISALRFDESEASLGEQGFNLANERSINPNRGQGFQQGLTPGLPSYGFTGTPGDVTYRGDFRQEVDFPFSIGEVRMMPYVVGRYTPYSESVDGSTAERVFAGTGIRASTAFWKIDDAARSSLFDIYRLRHVVEPELNVFASVQNTDTDELFIYEEQVDAVDDNIGIQLALHQRWQTKRGGPGRWRSVDVFTFNVEANYFDESGVVPDNFRSLYFPSLPEASIPRNGVNADQSWRISDQTIILAGQQYNLEEGTLALASLGLAVQRDPRLSYFIGTSFINDIYRSDQTVSPGVTEPVYDDAFVLTFSAEYELSTKYRVGFRQSFDFGLDESMDTSLTLLRKFDRLFASFSVRYDALEDERIIGFNLWPQDFGNYLSANRLQSLFGE